VLYFHGNFTELLPCEVPVKRVQTECKDFFFPEALKKIKKNRHNFEHKNVILCFIQILRIWFDDFFFYRVYHCFRIFTLTLQIMIAFHDFTAHYTLKHETKIRYFLFLFTGHFWTRPVKIRAQNNYAFYFNNTQFWGLFFFINTCRQLKCFFDARVYTIK